MGSPAVPPSIVDSFRGSGAGLGRIADRARSRILSGRALAGRSALVPAILDVLAAARLVPSVDWTVREARWSDTGVAIVPIGPPGEPARLIIKFADSRLATDALRAQRDRLARLHADRRLADWATIVPEVVHEGTIASLPYFVETALAGLPSTSLIHDPRLRRRFLPMAAEVIAGLHQRSAVAARVDDAMLDEWIEAPLRAIATVLSSRRGAGHETRVALEVLGRELRAGFAGRERSIGWIHGDYWPGNILVAADGRRISGIVDWSLAADRQLAFHDPIHLVLQARRLVSGRELGEVVRGLLDGDPLEPAEQAALAATGLRPPTWDRESRDVVLLAWLRFVGHLAPVNGPHRGWIRRNITTVLEAPPRRRPVGGAR